MKKICVKYIDIKNHTAFMISRVNQNLLKGVGRNETHQKKLRNRISADDDVRVRTCGCAKPADSKPAAAAADSKPAATAAGEDTIPVGILHSLTGTMSISEVSVKDAELMAIEEINAKGGVLGKKLKPVIEDGASDWPTFAEKAKKLLQKKTRPPPSSEAGPPPAGKRCFPWSNRTKVCFGIPFNTKAWKRRLTFSTQGRQPTSRSCPPSPGCFRIRAKKSSICSAPTTFSQNCQQDYQGTAESRRRQLG